jgi:pimeloyl-ACP methyl ester carboxylesterase
MSKLPVFLIGGAGPIARREFATLIEALDPARQIVPLDMVVFHGGPPPPDFSLEIETSALLSAMDATDAGRGHLLGYSGGAAVALAFACAHPERAASLTLEELAWVGSDGATALEERFWRELTAAMALEPYEALLAFRDLMVMSEVSASLPTVPPDAPWIANLVNGVRASIDAFARAEVDWGVLQGALFPIYAVVGSLSNPVFELRSRRLAERVARTRVDVFERMHHVVPPHRAAPDDLAERLQGIWTEAELAADVKKLR